MARLVECIPNFSISREKDMIGYNALVETAKSVPGCILFDAQSDGNHNRTVLTLLGSPEAVEETAFQLAKKAAEVIDMNHHVGEHSRMGATDVIPFVPTMGVTVEECVEISKRLGQRIWDELKIPSFLYEDSATREERRNLANCRKGQFEGMPEKLLQPDWAPDFGERKIHPTAGITAIGARPPLVAFNVNLATSDVQVAKNIAKVIRASSGGFRACKAMGFMLEDRNIAQVSMNMVNTEVTSIFVVYEMIKALAERYGTYVVSSELVGLSPAKALLDCAEFYLKLENFDCRKQVMEYHLLDMME
ncbi:MAG: glutamate formimidoyltransferase [Fretibacterium sp.]|nr:glutamate formimidoyltransferase [Fretibacterium sp.]